MSAIVHLPDPPNFQLFSETHDQRCGRCGEVLPTDNRFWQPGVRLLHFTDGAGVEAWIPELQAMGISFEGDVVECSALLVPDA